MSIYHTLQHIMSKIRYAVTSTVWRHFGRLIQDAKRLDPHATDLYCSLTRRKLGDTHPASHVGGLLCGELSHLTHELLRGRRNIEGSTVRVDRACRRDHTFVRVDDLYVDLTYKQFLQDDRSAEADCPYLSYVQRRLPAFFVGTHRELVAMLDDVGRRRDDHLGKRLAEKPLATQCLPYWET